MFTRDEYGYYRYLVDKRSAAFRNIAALSLKGIASHLARASSAPSMACYVIVYVEW